MYRYSKFGLGIATALAFGALASSASALTLRVSDSHNADHSTVIALEEMGQHLDERTNGEVKFKVFPNGVLGTEAEMINQLRTGILDIVRTNPADLEKFNPVYSAFLLPYLFNDDASATVAMNAVKDEVFQTHLDTGFMGIAWNIAPSRSFYTVNKQINTPEDLAGLKIRVPNSRSMADAVQLLGATPTPIPFGDVYTALQQGIVDGAEGSPAALIDSKQVEIVKYFSYDRHFLIPDVMIISTKSWDKLTDEQKAIFEDEAAIYTKRVDELEAAKNAKSLKECEDAGVIFTEVDMTPFKARVQPLYDEIAASNPEAAAIVDKIIAAQQ
ncbi:TRAP transporter substrate-binding protein [Martelella sp. HB161492]|uniref:TRAP transporter substrate-binding protein n=1 Tax=Martelella sp. HB161492 TaxID=2720726 RepID=UPI001590F84B|nr:TRAP transporter substrate-binding protein [Martelella sp. HB161492]